MATYWPKEQESGRMQLVTMPLGVYALYQEFEATVTVKLKAVTPKVLHRAPPPLSPVPLLMIPSVFVHPDEVVAAVNGSV